VLITAGPTQEPLDPVRFISNYSSGKMGYALAEAAYLAGAEVTVISGPCALPKPAGLHLIAVNTAQAMYDAVMQTLTPETIFIATAAVADFKPAISVAQKIKKQSPDAFTLSLQANPDIVAAVALGKMAGFVVGFAAETDALLTNARQKLQQKQLDMVVANQVGPGLGFGSDENQVVVITAEGEVSLPLQHKVRLAGNLIAMIAAKLQNSRLLLSGKEHEPLYSD
jgi:phosphopantothenoylcysteine decarboxylase/phosphopantothenate--cysteine ligase